MFEEKSDYFILAYDSPNFSAAAAQVPMTPQGFTKIIKNLERELGVPLFETDEHGMRKPTIYAEEYYQYATRIQRARKQLSNVFEKISHEGIVDMNVACAIGIPGLFSPEVIQGETYEHPQVNITFTEVPDTLCDSLVSDGYFDLGITVGPAANKLSSVELVSFPILILVNKKDPLSRKSVLSLDDLSGKKLAMPGKEFHVYNNLMQRYKDEDIPTPNIIEYAEIFWIYHFVLANKGYGFSLPHLKSLEVFSSSDDVAAIPLDDLKWQVVFTWPKLRNLLPYEQDYLAAIKKEIRHLKAKLK